MIERIIRCDNCGTELKPWELTQVTINRKTEAMPNKCVTLHFCNGHPYAVVEQLLQSPLAYVTDVND